MTAWSMWFIGAFAKMKSKYIDSFHAIISLFCHLNIYSMHKASRSDEYAWLQKFLSIFPTPWKKQAPFLTFEVLTMNLAHKPITQPRKKGPSHTHRQHHIFLNLHITAITIHPCNNSTNTYTSISSSSQNNHRHYQDLPTYPLNSVGCSPWPINNNNNNLRERTFL